ncbi:MAG: glycosyltransferase family 2 protein [Caulobacterales bacterium]|nr:glycosyltransferase family 2 protein [Caulobacterales bacterium]
MDDGAVGRWEASGARRATDDATQKLSPVRRRRLIYVPVPVKYAFALSLAIAWTGFSIWASGPWLHDLAAWAGWAFALIATTFIAYIPGFMNAFMLGTLLADRRPVRRRPAAYPAVTVLVAAYNEALTISETLRSLSLQSYPGVMEILVLDDGSTDETSDVTLSAIRKLGWATGHSARLLVGAENAGKAAVLNRGLVQASHEIIVTVDGDCWLAPEALRHLVERFLSDPRGTEAVAGAVLAKNSRESWLTRAQEWDYFHGIAAVKRMQSMYHGTLVAQGAFSLYRRAALERIGGWPDCVGEDIVVSWGLLKQGARIGYAEDAIAFTNVPERLGHFASQRKRWSRGLIEAFQAHGSLLVHHRMTTLFIWWNLLFLPIDLAYTLIFIPGLFLALIGHFHLAGPMTLLVLPLAVAWNLIIFGIQRRMFRSQGFRVRRNVGGFFFYALGYSLLMHPVCVWGYLNELLGLPKTWGRRASSRGGPQPSILVEREVWDTPPEHPAPQHIFVGVPPQEDGPHDLEIPSFR